MCDEVMKLPNFGNEDSFPPVRIHVNDQSHTWSDNQVEADEIRFLCKRNLLKIK